MEVEKKSNSGARPEPPRRTLKGIFLSYGPGIVVVLTWIGAGDLVDASIAGAHYGYGLMWALALSLIVRFLVTNIIARYQLCNKERLSIVEGFTRLHHFYAYFLGIYALIMGHLFNSYMIQGAGEALAWLFHFGHPFMWSVIVVLSGLFVLGRNIYNSVENLMKVILAVMSIAFIGLAVWSTPQVGEIIKGTVGFKIPDDVGFYGAFLVSVSLIGAVGGSIANFMYPYFMKDKGWVSPLHKKRQRNDLLFAIFAAIVIDLSIWVVGAEILKPNGIEITSMHDLSQALSIYFGDAGQLIFYLGILGALYSSVIGFSLGFPKVAIDALQNIKKERRKQYGEKPENDPVFKWFSLFILVTPILWSIPGMPGFVTMVVFVNVLSVVGLPVISIGLLIISNQKKMLGKYTNNWLENVLLVLTTILAIYSSVTLAVDTFF